SPPFGSGGTGGIGGNNQIKILCDVSRCTGFGDLTPSCISVESSPDQQGAPSQMCSASNYVALDLSDSQFYALPVPGVLAFGLSQIFNDNQRGLAMSFYTGASSASQFPASGAQRFLVDYRVFVESSVAAIIAFLASAAEPILVTIPSSCFPALSTGTQ